MIRIPQHIIQGTERWDHWENNWTSDYNRLVDDLTPYINHRNRPFSFVSFPKYTPRTVYSPIINLLGVLLQESQTTPTSTLINFNKLHRDADLAERVQHLRETTAREVTNYTVHIIHTPTNVSRINSLELRDSVPIFEDALKIQRTDKVRVIQDLDYPTTCHHYYNPNTLGNF